MSTARASVTAALPGRSSRFFAPRLSGRNSGVRAMVVRPMGTFTKSTQRQPNALVKSPPRMTPEAKPADATAPKVPRARLRPAPWGKVVVMSDRTEGATMEAASP